MHRDRELSAGPIVVRARCMEAWREAPPRVPIVPANRSMRMPRWHERTLWSDEQVLDGLSEAHWAAFKFDLPPELPPAVEARSVAWRYEVEARAPAAPAPRRARDSPCRSASARCCSTRASRCRSGSRERERPPQGRARLRPRGRRLRARAGGLSRPGVEAILARDGRGAGPHAARARRRHGQAHARADRQRRARDRARAGRRHARAAGRDRAGRGAARAVAEAVPLPTRASMP